MSKEAIKLQADIVNATAKLYELGYRIQCNYIYGAGWASEIVNINNGENYELDEHSKPKFQADDQAKIDAEQEKNNDYALDNMTSDDYDNAETWEELDKFDNSNYEDSDETVVIDDVAQMYDPTERLKMEDK